MSDTESLDYLQSGFDPSSLTVPRLRSILVAHAVPYPASAKKAQLIEIFNENVLPQSRRILASRTQAKRTSKGITDAESSQESTATGDGELMPPPPTPRARSARKASSRVKLEDNESEAPAARSPAKKTPRASSKHARPSDAETGIEADGIRKSARTSRKSETPRVKVEEKEDSLPKVNSDDSVFSDDNPFQSGSSPLSGIRSTGGERRRQTLGTAAAKDLNRKKSLSGTRRHTESHKVDDGIRPPTSRTFEISVTALTVPKNSDSGIEPSEEFTPEEQIELARERSLDGQGVVSRRLKEIETRRPSMTRPLVVILLTLLAGYAAWYRREKLGVGYCGVGRQARQMVPFRVQLPNWASVLIEPQCDPCPQHAYCYEQLETVCEPDFVLKPHPLSLGGLVPLPPTCEPDGEKVRRIKAVADRAVEELRDRRAKWECGDLVEEDGTPAAAVEINVDELKSEVGKKRRKGMTESEFEELWVGALGEINGREEVQSVTGPTGTFSPTRLSTNSLARVSLACAVKRSFRLAVARHRVQLATVILLIVLFFYGRYRYNIHIATIAALPPLVRMTLDRLATQAALHVQDREAFPEAWISVGQLRDDVLRDEHSILKREALWSRVRKVVEMNANVRASQREGRNGEISRVWEWIGAIAAIDGVEDRERRRKSGRVSWGTYGDASSPVSGTDGGPEIVQQKWMDSRPIY